LLDRLVEQASTNNYDLRRAEARLHEARALWKEARFDYAPTVHAGAGYEKSQLSKDAAGTKDRSSGLYRAGFDATWELDIWGAVRRNVLIGDRTEGGRFATLGATDAVFVLSDETVARLTAALVKE
jgi:multidrug efflux system outer membrane protein